MTRKDFELIAEAVKQAADNAANGYEAGAILAVASNLAKALRSTNGRFDADRFVRACGVV